MYKCSIFDKISFILVIVGALIWGVYGILGINIVNLIFGTLMPVIERVIYILVGISGINLIVFFTKLIRK